MKKEFIIGDNVFKYKKDILAHFKAILNSYDFGEELNANDKKDVFELLKLHPNFEKKISNGFKGFKVDTVRYNTKCFHIIQNDLNLVVFSYIKCINGSHSFSANFSIACRDIVQSDIISVKRKYFSQNSIKGQVKCQETGELCYWEELVIDHRQPNTFSVIVDRFIELNGIDLKSIEYVEIIDAVYTLKDKVLADNFQKYHRKKANLRIVKKGRNSGRTYQARVKQQQKDLRID